MGQTHPDERDERQESQTTLKADQTRRPLDLAPYRRRRQRLLMWQHVVHHLRDLVAPHGQHSATPIVSAAVADRLTRMARFLRL